jgi:hypothetical protein
MRFRAAIRTEKPVNCSASYGTERSGRASRDTALLSAEGQNKMAKKRAHPKRTKPAYKAAATGANTIPRQTGRELPGERRLQELNNAMEKLDDQDVDEDSSDAPEDIEGLPLLRSDDEEEEG